MNRKPRVLFVTTSFPRFENDFCGSFVFRLAKYLRVQGIPVTVIAPGAAGYPSNESICGISIFRATYFLPKKHQRLCYEGGGILANLRNSLLAKIQVPFLLIAMTLKIAKNLRTHDVIHCHWLPTVWLAKIAMILSLRKRPIVFTNWGSDTRLLPAALVKPSLKLVDRCVSTAAETDAHLRENGVEDFDSIMAPVDEDRFVETRNIDNIRKTLGIPENLPIHVFIGRLNYFKDPLTFIRACAVMRENGHAFQSILAGDGDLMNACKNEIIRLGLENHVLLLGERSDPEKLLSIATTAVHISPIENTWANIIAEAMFSGVPVILTKVGHTTSTFTHDENVLLIEKESPTELADAMILLQQTPDLRMKLIKGAKELLKHKKKDAASIALALDTLYTRLCASANDD